MQSAFKREEMISATAAAKNFGKVVSDIAEHKKEKTAVVRKNEIIAVILPVEEYEYMADVVEFFEHLEIFDIVTRRKKRVRRQVSLNKLLKEEGVSL
jgi:PHD/YefM family antitoxin component YafN of YafNO toxin-antitoxin module